MAQNANPQLAAIINRITPPAANASPRQIAGYEREVANATKRAKDMGVASRSELGAAEIRAVRAALNVGVQQQFQTMQQQFQPQTMQQQIQAIPQQIMQQQIQDTHQQIQDTQQQIQDTQQEMQDTQQQIQDTQQQTQAMQQQTQDMQQQTQVECNKVLALLSNATATEPDDPIVLPPNDAQGIVFDLGQINIQPPLTRAIIGNFTQAQANTFLGFYGEVPVGNLAMKRRAIWKFLGFPSNASGA